MGFSIVTLRKGEIQLLQSTMIGLVLSNILFKLGCLVITAGLCQGVQIRFQQRS